jgi:hypothetical protein
MALDGIVKGLLDQMAANPQPKLWDLAPAEGREMYRAMAAALEPPGLAIGKIENTIMPGPGGGEIKLRVYTPVAARSPTKQARAWSLSTTASPRNTNSPPPPTTPTPP